MEGKLTRDVKSSKKSFFENTKKETKEKSGWLGKVLDELEKWLTFRKGKEENSGDYGGLQSLKRCSALLQSARASVHYNLH